MQITNLFKIDPLKSFTELPAFRITIIFSISLATIFTVIIILNSNMGWRFDYVGFNSFVEIFRVPLSILAIAVTVIAILATMHRSAQTKEQILIANKQNAFSNYYKHIEEFEKYLENMGFKKKLLFENNRATHKYLFPNSFNGDYTVNREFLKTVDFEFSRIIDLLKEMKPNESKSNFYILYEAYSRLDIIFNLIYVKIKRSGKNFAEEGNRITVPDFYFGSVINDFHESAVSLMQILSFDHLFTTPVNLNRLANLNVEIFGDWRFYNG